MAYSEIPNEQIGILVISVGWSPSLLTKSKPLADRPSIQCPYFVGPALTNLEARVQVLTTFPLHCATNEPMVKQAAATPSAFKRDLMHLSPS